MENERKAAWAIVWGMIAVISQNRMQEAADQVRRCMEDAKQTRDVGALAKANDTLQAWIEIHIEARSKMG